MNFDILTSVCILAWLFVWSLAMVYILMPAKLRMELENKCKSWVTRWPLVGSKLL